MRTNTPPPHPAPPARPAPAPAAAASHHDVRDEKRARTLLWYLRAENVLILLAAWLVNLFVICVFAYGFYRNPDYDSKSVRQ